MSNVTVRGVADFNISTGSRIANISSRKKEDISSYVSGVAKPGCKAVYVGFHKQGRSCGYCEDVYGTRATNSESYIRLKEPPTYSEREFDGSSEISLGNNDVLRMIVDFNHVSDSSGWKADREFTDLCAFVASQLPGFVLLGVSVHTCIAIPDYCRTCQQAAEDRCPAAEWTDGKPVDLNKIDLSVLDGVK